MSYVPRRWRTNVSRGRGSGSSWNQTVSATAQERPWRSHNDKTTSVAPSTPLAVCRLRLDANLAVSATITSFTHQPCERPSIPAHLSKLISNRRVERRHNSSSLTDPLLSGEHRVMSSVKLLRLCLSDLNCLRSGCLCPPPIPCRSNLRHYRTV